jgi:type IV secretion system protein VirD4
VLHYQGDGHLVTIAPTRSGKGVSVIVPNLLVYPGSVVVTDPKGENYMLTQRRRRAARQHVWALDPFGITDAARHGHGTPGALNPLDVIDARSVDAPDDAALLADMLTLPEDTASGAGGDTHFEPEGRALLSALMLYVAATEPAGRRRSLLRVRELVTLPPDEFTKLLARMRECGSTSTVAHLGHAGTLIARGAARLQQKAEKERSGVVSTAQRCTHFLDSERMAAVLSETTVPLEHLREGRLSLYLVLPTERLSTYRAWMRLMVGVCLRTMVHQGAGEALAGQRHGQPGARPRVLFALDEFANLKRLAPVEDAFTIAAGYGVTFWLFLQDLAQLKAQYRQSWGTFLANADVLQTFGTNDLDTAKLVSELTGDATILVEGENASASVSHGRQGSRQEGSSQSLSEKARRLLTPDEVRRLPPDEALVFLRSRSPLRVRKLHYAHDAAFVGLYERPSAPDHFGAQNDAAVGRGAGEGGRGTSGRGGSRGCRRCLTVVGVGAVLHRPDSTLRTAARVERPERARPRARHRGGGRSALVPRGAAHQPHGFYAGRSVPGRAPDRGRSAGGHGGPARPASRCGRGVVSTVRRRGRRPSPRILAARALPRRR